MTKGTTGIAQANFAFHDFRTTGGEILPEVTLAYVTRGTLAADGRNAILITHGYTSGPRMIEPGVASSEGAWSTLVGPGAPIDTDRYFVVCSNMLGSSYGSTNAASIDPRTGKPYGSKFPNITVEDIVTAQKRLLNGLGVTHLRAVVGPSYGGFQAFQWGVTFPDFMDGIVPVVTSPRPPNSDRVAGLLKWFEPDPNWNGGDYYDTPGVKQTLTALRVDTLTRYGMANSLAARFPTRAAADAELHRIAAGWADVFDANSLFILGRAMETYDVVSRFDRIKVPVLFVLSRTDALFPPTIAPGVMDGLKKAGVDASYYEIDSEHGHLASGADADKWAPALRAFMTKLETA
jgi:homoserine O-acetyltransferase